MTKEEFVAKEAQALEALTHIATDALTFMQGLILEPSVPLRIKEIIKHKEAHYANLVREVLSYEEPKDAE